jgi:AraC family transcriptional regulator
MLLARPGVSVTEIAMRLGFAETSAFSTTFRKATGRTPSDFGRGLL